MKKMLRKGFVLGVTLLCGTSLVGCAEQANNDVVNSKEGTESEVLSGDVYKIGGIGPLTGAQSSYGNSVKQGAEIAIEKINEEGGVNGKKLALVFEDDVCDEEKAITAYNKIMDEEPVAIMGAVTSGCSVAVSGESINDGILQVTPSGSTIKCTEEANSFRICFTDPIQGETMAKFVAEKGYKNVAIIYDVASDYSKGIKDAFVAEAKNNEMNIVAEESFNSGDVDFKTQLTKIKSSGADCIFLPIYYAEVAAITEQAKTVGIDLPYFGCDGWDGVIKELEGETAEVEGAVFLTPFIATLDVPEIKEFTSVYNETYGSDPGQFAADGYDAIYAIKLAIEQCGDEVTNEKMIEAMTKIEVKGLTGDMTFTPEGEPNKTVMFAEIKDGAYVAVQ